MSAITPTYPAHLAPELFFPVIQVRRDEVAALLDLPMVARIETKYKEAMIQVGNWTFLLGYGYSREGGYRYRVSGLNLNDKLRMEAKQAEMLFGTLLCRLKSDDPVLLEARNRGVHPQVMRCEEQRDAKSKVMHSVCA